MHYGTAIYVPQVYSVAAPVLHEARYSCAATISGFCNDWTTYIRFRMLWSIENHHQKLVEDSSDHDSTFIARKWAPSQVVLKMYHSTGFIWVLPPPSMSSIEALDTSAVSFMTISKTIFVIIFRYRLRSCSFQGLHSPGLTDHVGDLSKKWLRCVTNIVFTRSASRGSGSLLKRENVVFWKV